ncbi:LacI family DNA-binding transcriptional regulator [Bengtsoniella intestinalis]|uniref:LacI family DNA-binding transcriptional regulator n=1 Tax=Bengtsoniella intestinalis TaxID=3073143 RepID=UPI00391F8521
MSTTLKDIADEVGVSLSTVYRAISGDPVKKVRKSTCEKIAQAMQRSDYPLDAEATAFLQTTLVPVMPVVPTIGIILASHSKSFAHPFFAEMLEAVQIEIARNGFVVEYVLAESAMGEDALRQIVATQPVSGAILLGRLDQSLLQFLKNAVPHLVYTGVNYLEYDTDEVVCDGVKAVATVYDHFTSLNYPSIGYIGPVASSLDSRNEHHRHTSYLQCLSRQGATPNHNWIENAQDTAEDGYQAMRRMIVNNHLPRAIICAADTIACGVLRATQEMGIRVPQDVAIASIDNINIGQFFTPSLTTVEIFKDDLARLSVNMLKDKIENGRAKSVRLDVPHELVIRESCGYQTNI